MCVYYIYIFIHKVTARGIQSRTISLKELLLTSADCLIFSPRPQALWGTSGLGLRQNLATQVAPGSSHHSPPLLFVHCNFAGLQLFELKFSILYLYLSPNMWRNFP